MRVFVLGLLAVLGSGLGGCAKAAPQGTSLASSSDIRQVPADEGRRCGASAECSGGMACVDNRVRCITSPCDAHFYECRSTCDEQGAGCPEGCTCETGTRATIDEGQARVCDCPSEASEPPGASDR